MVRSCHHGQFVDVHSGDGAMSDIGEGEQVLVAVRAYTERQSFGLYQIWIGKPEGESVIVSLSVPSVLRGGLDGS